MLRDAAYDPRSLRNESTFGWSGNVGCEQEAGVGWRAVVRVGGVDRVVDGGGVGGRARGGDCGCV
jgi:hypothetical protein